MFPEPDTAFVTLYICTEIKFPLSYRSVNPMRIGSNIEYLRIRRPNQPGYATIAFSLYENKYCSDKIKKALAERELMSIFAVKWSSQVGRGKIFSITLSSTIVVLSSDGEIKNHKRGFYKTSLYSILSTPAQFRSFLKRLLIYSLVACLFTALLP